MFNYGEDHLKISTALDILNGKIKAQISEVSQQKIERCHQSVMHMAAKSHAVYGINTGFGPLCNTKISQEETSILQKKLLLSHSVGVGEPIDSEISKLMLILKVHSLAKGYSGISLDILYRILWHIENDIIPVVPSQGSVGASGDLAPLSHLFLPLIGHGEVVYKDRRSKTDEVLKLEGKSPLELGPKSGLALINGTQFIAAHSILIVSKLHNCLAHADIISALMIESLLGSKTPFDHKIHQIRPYKGNIHVAERVNFMLTQSEINSSHEDCDRVQDPYSLRCVPQVHGTSRQAWLHLKEAVEIEINSVTDNPIVFSDNETISGGNFHGQPLALPIDYACLAASELGNISDRRSYLSLEGKTKNTPKLLMNNTGVNSGLMIVQYTGAALASENKTMCFPASADSIPTSLGQEDHVSMGSIGSRKALHVCNNLQKILAIELFCASQALEFRRPLTSSPLLEEIHSYIRKSISFAEEDRLFYKDIEKANQIIESQELLKIFSNHLPSNKQRFGELFENY